MASAEAEFRHRRARRLFLTHVLMLETQRSKSRKILAVWGFKQRRQLRLRETIVVLLELAIATSSIARLDLPERADQLFE